MKRKEKNMARIAYGFNTIMSLCWHASLLGQKWDFILSLVISNCQSYVYKIIHKSKSITSQKFLFHSFEVPDATDRVQSKVRRMKWMPKLFLRPSESSIIDFQLKTQTTQMKYKAAIIIEN